MKKVSFGFIFILFFFNSCNLSIKDNNPILDDPENMEISEKTELFVYNNTINTYTFETNDKRFLSEKGYTLWSTPIINKQETFEPLAVSVVNGLRALSLI